MSDIAYRLVNKLGAVHLGGNEYAARCPVCGDSKKDPRIRRFTINVAKDKFYCHNGGCNASGRDTAAIIRFLIKLGEEITSSDLALPTPQEIVPPPQEVKDPISKEAIELLKKAVYFEQTPKVVQRLILKDLIPRKVFTLIEIKDLLIVPPRVRFNWDWRVIIPVNHNVFQGKSLFGKKPKYLSPPDLVLVHNGIMANEENCKIDETILVGEGILDFWSVGRENSLCVVGSGRFTSENVLKVYEKYDNVILCPDSDLAGFMVVVKLFEDNPNLKNVHIFFPHWVSKTAKDLNDLLRQNGLSQKELRNLVSANSRTIKSSFLDITSNKIKSVFFEGKKKWVTRTLEL